MHKLMPEDADMRSGTVYVDEDGVRPREDCPVEVIDTSLLHCKIDRLFSEQSGNPLDGRDAGNLSNNIAERNSLR
jgi:hypothetical protein